MTDTTSALVAFIRARHDDLRDTADRYHVAHGPDVCDSTDGTDRNTDGPHPCNCPEPNRRRRRAFTHGNLVDWAEQAAAVCDADGCNLDPADVLRHLAAEWSDHPDYLTEWAPLP